MHRPYPGDSGLGCAAAVERPVATGRPDLLAHRPAARPSRRPARRVHPKRLSELDPFPGYIRDLAVAGDRAYVAAGSAGLRILDAADPRAPRELGALDTPGDARAVAIDGPLAFVADGPGGLRVIDISQPAAARTVGVLDTIQVAQAVAARNGLAYVTVAGPGSAALLVVDVSDPTRPRELFATATHGEALGLALAGDYAYLADGPGGLLTLDVSDPKRPPMLTAVLDIPATSILVQAGMTYAASAGNGGGLWTLDLIIPTAPTVNKVTTTLGGISDLAFHDEGIYAARRSHGIVTFAAAPRTAARYLGFLDAPGLQATDVVLSGDLAYVTDTTGLRAVDISVPARPRELGRLEAPKCSRGLASDGGALILLACRITG